jgi:hypothetical protein
MPAAIKILALPFKTDRRFRGETPQFLDTCACQQGSLAQSCSPPASADRFDGENGVILIEKRF